MVPSRYGCMRKFRSSGNCKDLKTPRWSGQKTIHLRVRPTVIHLLALVGWFFNYSNMGLGLGLGEFQDADKVSLDCHHGTERDEQKGY